MHNMKRTTKILLTIPSILGLSYMLTFIYPVEFHWLVPSMQAYYIQIGIINGLTIIQLIILIKKLWSFKYIEKSRKSDWTWILIIFNQVASLIFIWKQVDEFAKLNKSTVSNND
jgi:formate-dependent nitrite reductase membrane component NrfD